MVNKLLMSLSHLHRATTTTQSSPPEIAGINDKFSSRRAARCEPQASGRCVGIAAVPVTKALKRRTVLNTAEAWRRPSTMP
jgi:hypothetical protein